jgi:hypothetical protein
MNEAIESSAQTRTDAIELETGPDARLLVGQYENAAGKRLVTIAPQYRDQGGAWRLSHSGLMLVPDVARELAPALVQMAETIDTDAAREGAKS